MQSLLWVVEYGILVSLSILRPLTNMTLLTL